MGTPLSKPHDSHQPANQPIPALIPTANKQPRQPGILIPSSPRPLITTSRPLREPQRTPKPSPSQLSSLPTLIHPSNNPLRHKTLQTGAYSAGTGLLFGTFYGIFRGQPPLIYPLVSSIQWGLAGTIFSGVRSLALDSLGETRETRFSATMVAGVVAGVAAGAVNGGGGGKVMRFAALGGVAGLGGQGFVDWRAERRSRLGGERKSFLTWLTTGKYSVFRKLSDAEYVDMLEAQLIRVEAEIAVLEDKVRSLKGSDGGVGDAGG